MPRLAVLPPLLLCVLVAGCGGSGASGGDDPASLVPGDATVYVEATLRPEGQLRDDALDAAGQILGTSDPQRRIDELVGQAFAESGGPELDYARDVKPWLGSKAGFWTAGAGEGEKVEGAAVLSSTDTDKAQETFDRLAKESDKRFSSRSYEDVDYKVSEDGDAVAIVEDFAVFGTEAEVKRTIRAADGDALGEADGYKDAIGELEDSRLAHLYVDTKALVEKALAADPDARQQAEPFLRGLEVDKLGPITASFAADGNRLAIDSVVSGSGSDVLQRFGALAGTGSTPLLGELPGDSWGALGAPKLGETARGLYQQFAGALGGVAIAQQLRSELGLDLEQDVFSWIGDVAFFVRGTSADQVDGGAVIEVLDREKAQAAFGKIVGVLQARGGVRAKPVRVEGAESAFELSQPGEPVTLVAALGSDRVVIGYGVNAAEDALSPDEKLGDGPTFSEAKSMLGDLEPGFVLAMPAVITLAESMAAGDPEFAEAKRYLEALGVLTAGGKLDDDQARSRFAAGLK